MASVTRTVLFTDLANYTASVVRADREALRNLITEHEAFVAPLLRKHNGNVLKNLGDSFLALFPSATEALRAGIDVVESGLRDRGLVIRVSCASGDVEEMGGDAFGDAVNLSSRINSRTPAGEIWFSESTRQCMKQAEIPWEPVGTFQLKGLAGDMACYRAITALKCHLPDPIVKAVKQGTLCRIRPGEAPPPLPPDPTILLEGFQEGSAELAQAVDTLPVLDPASIWLSVYKIPPTERHEWLAAGRGLVVGTAEALAEAITLVRTEISTPVGSNTIILDLEGQAELDLVMAGLALPAVPYADVVAGYTYDLLPDGRWVPRSNRALLRVDVSPEGVRAKALGAGVTINGRTLAPNQAVDLTEGSIIQAAGARIRYSDVSDPNYAGLLVSDSTTRMGVARGQLTELGREPNHPGLALPDRTGQANIRWCAGSRAARAREGGFTLDRALAGRRQAALEVSPTGQVKVRALHDRLPTWLYDESGLRRVESTAAASVNDLVVTGTSIIALRPPLA